MLRRNTWIVLGAQLHTHFSTFIYKNKYSSITSLIEQSFELSERYS